MLRVIFFEKKLLLQSDVVFEEKEYTQHEMKNFRLKHILDIENINKNDWKPFTRMISGL